MRSPVESSKDRSLASLEAFQSSKNCSWEQGHGVPTTREAVAEGCDAESVEKERCRCEEAALEASGEGNAAAVSAAAWGCGSPLLGRKEEIKPLADMVLLELLQERQ